MVSPPCLFVYGIPNKSNRVAKLKKIKKIFQNLDFKGVFKI